ncbi:O-antigen ligase family protein [Bosea sp. Root381]|uniref:O-antigen ligase family protein n=1 Tax=Bosea sp. Root381 TaxID=1736524 RepID=UPI0012E363EB|nr:O-antigen ligase family protein [Bosea sp. Root381]
MSTAAPHEAGFERTDGAPPLAGRLAALGMALLVVTPLAMWLANRSAPLILGLSAAAFVVAALVAEGWRPLLRRLLASLRGPIALSLCAFLAWSLVTLAWSHRPAQGLAAWGELILPLAFALAIAASGRFRPGLPDDRWLAFAVIAAVALMIAELSSGLAVRTMLDIGKQAGFVFNRPALTCLVLSAALLPALLRAPILPRDRLLAGLVMLAVVVIAAFSHSGAAALGLAIMVACWLAALLLPRLALAAVALAFAATMLLAPFLGRLGDSALPPAMHERLAGSHSRERVDIWLSFGEAIQLRPLLGSGFGTSPALDRHPMAMAVSEAHRPMLAVGHPHSAPMQAWVETGAIGAAFLTFAGLGLLFRLRHLPADQSAPRLALFAAAFGIASLAHGAWQGWWIASLALATLWLFSDRPARIDRSRD